MDSQSTATGWMTASLDSKYPHITSLCQQVSVDTLLQDVSEYHITGRHVDCEYSATVEFVNKFINRYLLNLHTLAECVEKTEKSLEPSENTKNMDVFLDNNTGLVNAPSVVLLGFSAEDIDAIIYRINAEIQGSERLAGVILPVNVLHFPEILQSYENLVENNANIAQIRAEITASSVIPIPLAQIAEFRVQMSHISQHYTNSSKFSSLFNIFDYVLYNHTLTNHISPPSVLILSVIKQLLRPGGLMFFTGLVPTSSFYSKKHLEQVKIDFSYPQLRTLLLNHVVPAVLLKNFAELLQSDTDNGAEIIEKITNIMLNQFLPSKNDFLSILDLNNDELDAILQHSVDNIDFYHSYSKIIKSQQKSFESQVLANFRYNETYITSLYTQPASENDTLPIFHSAAQQIEDIPQNNQNPNSLIKSLLLEFGIISPILFESILFYLTHLISQSQEFQLLSPYFMIYQSSNVVSMVEDTVNDENALLNFVLASIETPLLELNSTNPYCTKTLAVMYDISPPEERRAYMAQLEDHYNQLQRQNASTEQQSSLKNVHNSSFEHHFPLLFHDGDSDIDPTHSLSPITQTQTNNPRPMTDRPPSPTFYYYSMDESNGNNASMDSGRFTHQSGQISGLPQLILNSDSNNGDLNTISTPIPAGMVENTINPSLLSLSLQPQPQYGMFLNPPHAPSPTCQQQQHAPKRSISRPTSTNNLYQYSNASPQLTPLSLTPHLQLNITNNNANITTGGDLLTVNNSFDLKQLHTHQTGTVQQGGALNVNQFGLNQGNSLSQPNTPTFSPQQHYSQQNNLILPSNASNSSGNYTQQQGGVQLDDNMKSLRTQINTPLLRCSISQQGFLTAKHTLFRHNNKLLQYIGQRYPKKSQQSTNSSEPINTTTAAPPATSQQPDEEQEQPAGKTIIERDLRPIVEARKRLLITGYSVGLPNASNAPEDFLSSPELSALNNNPKHLQRKVFSQDNIFKLLHGYNFLSTLTTTDYNKILAMNPFELGKSPDGKRVKNYYNHPSKLIHVQSKISCFDLSAQFGVPSYVVEALDMTFQLAIAAGLEALCDAGYPILQRTKIEKEKKLDNITEKPDDDDDDDDDDGDDQYNVTIHPLPPQLRSTTGVIFVASFPGMDSIVDEVERCSLSQMRQEVISMLKEHPLSQHNDSLSAQQRTEMLQELSEIVQLNNNINTDENGNIISDEHKKVLQLDDIITKLEQHPVYEYNRKLLFKVLVMANSQLAELIRATGPNTHCNAACAGTTQALAIADDWLRTSQRCEACVVIAADIATSKRLMPYLSTGFMVLGAASKLKGISTAAAPFDIRRKGMIVGAGTVGIVLETYNNYSTRKYWNTIFKTQFYKEGITDGGGQEGNMNDMLKLSNIPYHTENYYKTQEPQFVIPNEEEYTKINWELPQNWTPKGELLMSHYNNSAYHASLINTKHIAQEMNNFLTQLEIMYGNRLRVEWESQRLLQLFEQKKSAEKTGGGAEPLKVSQNSLLCDTTFNWKKELAKQLIYFSHETSTASCAKVEVNALAQYFNKKEPICATAETETTATPDFLKNIIVCNTKGYTGHAMGVAFEDVMAVASLHHQVTPPIANLQQIDPNFENLISLSIGGSLSKQNEMIFNTTIPHSNDDSEWKPQKRTLSLRFSAGFGSQLVMLLFKTWDEDNNMRVANFLNIPSTSTKLQSNDITRGFDIVPVTQPHRRDEAWYAFTMMCYLQSLTIQETKMNNLNLGFSHLLQTNQQLQFQQQHLFGVLPPRVDSGSNLGVINLAQNALTPQNNSQINNASLPPPHAFGTLPHPQQLSDMNQIMNLSDDHESNINIKSSSSTSNLQLPPLTATLSTSSSGSSMSTLRSRPSFQSQQRLMALMNEQMQIQQQQQMYTNSSNIPPQNYNNPSQ